MMWNLEIDLIRAGLLLPGQTMYWRTRGDPEEAIYKRLEELKSQFPAKALGAFKVVGATPIDNETAKILNLLVQRHISEHPDEVLAMLEEVARQVLDRVIAKLGGNTDGGCRG